MPRIARNSFDTPFFHLITQGINKEFIFNKKVYIEKYLQLLKKYENNYDVNILAYCIMNNHAHILIYSKKSTEMASFMHKVNCIYAQYYNRQAHRVGVVFRNRYVSEPIYCEDYLIKCIKYIHSNPVKAKIVERCEDYLYSTYIDYISNSGVTKSPILLDMFGNVDYVQLFNLKYDDVLFNDIETDKEQILEFGIKKFENENNITLQDIKNNSKIFSKLIFFLKINFKIPYSVMMKKFNISQWDMNRLKQNFETRP